MGPVPPDRVLVQQRRFPRSDHAGGPVVQRPRGVSARRVPPRPRASAACWSLPWRRLDGRTRPN